MKGSSVVAHNIIRPKDRKKKVELATVKKFVKSGNKRNRVNASPSLGISD